MLTLLSSSSPFAYTTLFRSLIMLSVATAGFHGAETVLKGGLNFIIMTSSGVVFGLIMAAAFSHALRLTKSNEFATVTRSEEHTSELQSRGHLVCRLLLEKHN